MKSGSATKLLLEVAFGLGARKAGLLPGGRGRTDPADAVRAAVRGYEDARVAAYSQISDIAAARKPKWYILGTEGAIVDMGREGKFTVYTHVRDHIASFEVKHYETVWNYNEKLADHLVKGAPNPVTPESARRVIAQIEMAERSHKTGKEQVVPYE